MLKTTKAQGIVPEMLMVNVALETSTTYTPSDANVMQRNRVAGWLLD